MLPQVSASLSARVEARAHPAALPPPVLTPRASHPAHFALCTPHSARLVFCSSPASRSALRSTAPHAVHSARPTFRAPPAVLSAHLALCTPRALRSALHSPRALHSALRAPGALCSARLAFCAPRALLSTCPQPPESSRLPAGDGGMGWEAAPHLGELRVAGKAHRVCSRVQTGRPVGTDPGRGLEGESHQGGGLWGCSPELAGPPACTPSSHSTPLSRGLPTNSPPVSGS